MPSYHIPVEVQKSLDVISAFYSKMNKEARQFERTANVRSKKNAHRSDRATKGLRQSAKYRIKSMDYADRAYVEIINRNFGSYGKFVDRVINV